SLSIITRHDHLILHPFPTRRSSDLTLENHGVDPEHIGQRVNTLLSAVDAQHLLHHHTQTLSGGWVQRIATVAALAAKPQIVLARSEEHTSELQSRFDLVCRLLLEKK